MKSEDLDSLIRKLQEALATGGNATVGIIGATPEALSLVGALSTMQVLGSVTGLYDAHAPGFQGVVPYKPFEKLGEDRPSIVLIASDENKEQLLLNAVPYLGPSTRVLVAGFAHFEFRDAIFADESGKALIPSLANGYPNSLVHIYQCLRNAARLDLKGAVVEFGMFKGGTTMLMSRFIERLGATWKVYGFDSFAGFPPPRSALDMYAHPDCVYLDEPMVRRMFAGRNVEIVSGDIVQSVARIKDEPIVLAFVDTDNFSPANAVLDTIQNNVVPGGAIVFDHFTGRNRFLYTIGERIAAKRLLEDARYFNLHDTGVFLRQR